jgi:hypothetical protein
VITSDDADHSDSSRDRRLNEELDRALDAYLDQVSAFADLLDAVVPAVQSLDGADALSKRLIGVVKPYPNATKVVFTEVLRNHTGEEGFDVNGFMLEARDRLIAEKDGASLWFALHYVFIRRPRLPILLSSTVTAVVGAFEAITSIVLTEFFVAAPQALEAVPREKEREFSLKDLKELSTIDDAIALAVSRRVDDLNFGSFADRRRFLKEKVRIDLADLAGDWNLVLEIFERRNALVHHAGRASPRYVNTIATLGSRPPDVGASLACDERYVRVAIEQFLILGVALITSLWVKLVDDSELAIAELSNASYKLLVREEWVAVAKLCSLGEQLAVAEDDKWVFRINRAIAEIHTRGVEAVSKEVASWDVSALSKRFRMAKECLVGNTDAALGLLADLIESGEVTGLNLMEWPLFSSLREDPGFSDLPAPKEPTTLVMAPHSSTVHSANCARRPSRSVPISAALALSRNAKPCKVCSPTIDSNAEAAKKTV